MENAKILLPDGITKIMVNSKAAAKAVNTDLKDFLEYMNGKKTESLFIQELECNISKVKENAKKRGLMLLNAIEMDVRLAVWNKAYYRAEMKVFPTG